MGFGIAILNIIPTHTIHSWLVSPVWHSHGVTGSSSLTEAVSPNQSNATNRPNVLRSISGAQVTSVGDHSFNLGVTPKTSVGADNRYCGQGNIPKFGTNDGPAQLPRACFYTGRNATPSPGKVVAVGNGESVNRAIARANCGDIVELQAGAAYSEFVSIPAKSCDDQHWITIRTSSYHLLPPEGVRITPCYAGVATLPGRSYSCSSPQNLMPKIVVIASGAGMEFAPGANHYRFIGIEFTRRPGIGIVYGLVGFRNGTQKIIFDQCWFHGDDDSNGDETKVGVNLGLSYLVGVVDSYFNDFYCVAEIGTCTDAVAIGGGVGLTSGDWGAYKIVNNFLEAAGENILFGGGEATITPQDIEIRRNLFFKPFTWMPSSPTYDGGSPEVAHRNSFLRRFTWLPDNLRYGGGPAATGRHKPLIVKNLFELKNATRVLVEGNIFENSWGGFSQEGPGILLTPANQSNQAPNAKVTNITMRYNIIRYTGQPLQIATVDTDPVCKPNCLNAGINNLSLHDLLMDHIEYGGCYGKTCTPYFNEILTGDDIPASHQLHDLTINHITEVLDNQIGTSMFALGGPTAKSGGQMYNFTLKNSIMPAGDYGIGGGPPPNDCGHNQPISTPYLAACFGGTLVFGSNVIPWGSTHGGTWASIGRGGALQLLADQKAVQYKSLSEGDYRLLSTSPGHNAADDGTDIGANVNTVNTYTQGVQ
jgi:hypothetical protein